MATATKDTVKEAEFLNFLTKYDLEQYHEGLLAAGIKKIEHLNHVKQEDLTDIGLSRTEGQRLLDKYDRHFSKIGKFKVCHLRDSYFCNGVGTRPFVIVYSLGIITHVWNFSAFSSLGSNPCIDRPTLLISLWLYSI